VRKHTLPRQPEQAAAKDARPYQERMSPACLFRHTCPHSRKNGKPTIHPSTGLIWVG
jgi:hypothetical protein